MLKSLNNILLSLSFSWYAIKQNKSSCVCWSSKCKILFFLISILSTYHARIALLQRLYLLSIMIINQMLRLILMMSVNGVDDYNSALLLVWECRSQWRSIIRQRCPTFARADRILNCLFRILLLDKLWRYYWANYDDNKCKTLTCVTRI